MKVLAVDTSSSALNIGVIEEKKILGTISINGMKNHSVTMLKNVDELLEKLNLTPKEIDRIVVTKGPGSYTGLRIGVTFSKTLSWTLKKELVGVSTLEALACNIKSEGYIAPVLDARRENVYTGLYQRINGQLVQVEKDQHISLSQWLQFLQTNHYQDVTFLGETENFKEEINEASFLVHSFSEDNLINGATLGFLGLTKEPERDIEGFIPAYLKKVEAEENWQKAHPGIVEENYVEKN